MKKTITAIFALAAVLAVGCKKEEIQTFADLNDANYIYFYNTSYGFGNTYFATRDSYADSLETSFFLYPGQDEIELTLNVSRSGYSEADTRYKVEVVPEGTTAEAGADYTMPSDFVFPGGERTASFPVTVRKDGNLNLDTLRIELRLVDGGDYKVGPSHQSRKVIIFHEDVLKPSWWTGLNYITNGFGTWTKEKYLVVMEVTGNYPFDENTPPSIIREWALKVRQYLREQKAAGNTIREANGAEMTIPAGGN